MTPAYPCVACQRVGHLAARRITARGGVEWTVCECCDRKPSADYAAQHERYALVSALHLPKGDE
jgi:protein-arginine kinase activator protein McsA